WAGLGGGERGGNLKKEEAITEMDWWHNCFEPESKPILRQVSPLSSLCKKVPG
ncbi:hypothetical protein NPIL_461701, partial [Nephila pilipes]